MDVDEHQRKSDPEDPDNPKFDNVQNFEAWLAADDKRRGQPEGTPGTGPPAGRSAGSAALKAEDDDNDVRTIRAKAQPKQPTRIEVEEHEASGHLPY
jgi:hypothetical protein